MDSGFHITRAALDGVVAHARAADPAECCGVLLGRDYEITDAVPARNLSDDPSRFLVDPVDHIDARRDGRRRGLAVIGFYHSHPHSPAAPSDTDCAEVTYPDHLCVIVGLMTDPAEVRAFQFKDGSFHEASLRWKD